MTLTEVHSDLHILAGYLQVDYAPGVEMIPTYSSRGPRAVDISADEVVRRAWGDYREHLDHDYLRRHPPQTWNQFVAECLREVYGIKGRGNLAGLIGRAIARRPDLYSTPETVKV